VEPRKKKKSTWDVNIKIDLQEIRYKVVDWIHLAQDTVYFRGLVNTVMKIRVPYRE
jgi:hypothetical protein